MPSQTNQYQSSKPQRDGEFAFERLGNFFSWLRLRLAIVWAVCWILGGIFFAHADFGTLQEAFLSRNWQKATGKIIPNKKNLLRAKNSVRIRYTFRIDGRTHQGTRIRILGEYFGIHSKNLDNAVLKQSVQKKTCLVFYDPEDPNRCALQSGIRWHHLLPSGIGCVLVLIGILGFWLIKQPDSRGHTLRENNLDASPYRSSPVSRDIPKNNHTQTHSRELDSFLAASTPRHTIPQNFIEANRSENEKGVNMIVGTTIWILLMGFGLIFLFTHGNWIVFLACLVPGALGCGLSVYFGQGRARRKNILRHGVAVEARIDSVKFGKVVLQAAKLKALPKKEEGKYQFKFTFLFHGKTHEASQVITYLQNNPFDFFEADIENLVRLLVDPLHPERVIWADATLLSGAIPEHGGD